MNKTDLARVVSTKVGLPPREAKLVVEFIFEVIKEGLAKGEKWEIRGLGTFKVRENASRMGRIMATGQKIKIPAYKAPIFTPGKILKRIVNLSGSSPKERIQGVKGSSGQGKWLKRIH